MFFLQDKMKVFFYIYIKAAGTDMRYFARSKFSTSLVQNKNSKVKNS